MEDKTIQTIMKVAEKLAPQYAFGYYDEEDIEQECYIMAINAIEKYDSSIGSLENFLYTHLNYKLQNLWRKKYYRRNFECKICGGNDPECSSCDRRRRRFLVKKHLLEPIDIQHVTQNYYIDNPSKNLELEEIFIIINKNLEIELRADYLRMLDGITIPKVRRTMIEGRVVEILEEHGYEYK